MGRKGWQNKYRKASARGLKSVVSLAEVQSRMARVQKICKQRHLGPGTPEYSLKCRLSALNGNWPRIKENTWRSVEADYRRLIVSHAANDLPLRSKVDAKGSTVCELCRASPPRQRRRCQRLQRLPGPVLELSQCRKLLARPGRPTPCFSPTSCGGTASTTPAISSLN